MSAPSGYNFSITVNATPMNFKGVSVRETSTQIDSTSKYNPDGTINTLGSSDTDGDIRTLFIDIDQLIKDDDVLGNISFLAAGESYINTGFAVSYGNAPMFSGNSFYVSSVDISGSIPGESRFRVSLQSKGAYTRY